MAGCARAQCCEMALWAKVGSLQLQLFSIWYDYTLLD